MATSDQNASDSADPRTIREKIADALIPRHCGFARAAYCLGNDAALLGFLAIPEYNESRFPWYAATARAVEPRLADESRSADLLPFLSPQPR
jgi:hypothetical protein